ncbi:MAG: endolytic transglycosylase MltG [Patescibacteria group bacterium]
MRKLTILIIIITIAIISGAIWWKAGTSPVNSQDKKQYTFVIGKNESVREISNRLREEGFIKDRVAFFVLVNFILDVDKNIQAGDHRLSPSMNTREIAKSLTLATNDIWVTIPEGLRAEEIADILKKEITSYNDSWRKKLIENEGYLFPDTYLVPKVAEIDQILLIFKSTFETKYNGLDKSKTKFSKDEIVTIASLVEREAKHASDRPLVASVIINRLGLGMKLDIDATVQYALGYQEDEKDWWKKALTFEDLEINSPYNTYRNAGLPPSPISNPGLASLEAAISPANTNYLYYISDKSGINRYAETLEEHNQNIEKYSL